jgi:WD40 repeat protein
MRIQTFVGHSDNIDSVAFSQDGRRVITGSSDKTAIVWDRATAERVETLTGHSDRIRLVAFSPNGRRVLTGSDDNTIVLWDVASGELLARCYFTKAGLVVVTPSGLFNCPDSVLPLLRVRRINRLERVDHYAERFRRPFLWSQLLGVDEGIEH